MPKAPHRSGAPTTPEPWGAPRSPPCATDLASPAGSRALRGSGTGEVFWQGQAPGAEPGGTRSGVTGGRRGEGGEGGIAPRDLTGPCPRGARRGHPSAPVNRKERQNAAKRWDSPAGERGGGHHGGPRARPTRWSRTPGAPGKRRRCGTAGAGWWGRRTPAPGWFSEGAGR